SLVDSVFSEAFRFGGMLPTPPVCGLITTTTMAVDHTWHMAAPRGVWQRKMLQTMMQMSLANSTSRRTATCLLYHSSQIASSQSLLQHHSLTQFS
ncbi:MAG: hypothetical protein ACKPKO_11065, partial [Candidatus Fonsibacter sp.]